MRKFLRLFTRFSFKLVRIDETAFRYTKWAKYVISARNIWLHRKDCERNMEGKASNYPLEDVAASGREKSDETFKEWEKYLCDSLTYRVKTECVYPSTKDSEKRETSDSDSSIRSSCSDSQGNNRRWFFAMRHGERVDLTYGQWVPYCFDENDTYIRKDLNMPLKLAEREGGSESYAKDTPLTRVGRLQARLVGEALRLAGIPVTHVYASAALRSVETAQHFLEGLEAESSVNIRVEPGLFECKQWYMASGMAPFMTLRELHKAGYNVDLRYIHYVDVDIKTTETLQQWYKRNETVIHSAVRDTAADGGNVIFVGHAATLDLMVSALKRIGKNRSKPAKYQLSKNLIRVPYCALGAMRDNPWQVVSPPCPPSINSSSGRFDCKILADV